ncbi:MAG: N-acetyltransferase [Pseudomonadota bacterium]
MVIGPDYSHDLKDWQIPQVDILLRTAFGGEDEVRLVHALRQDGDMVTEMVTPWKNRIAGYAALSRMRQPEGWLCLAPVAVWPEFQRGALTPDGLDKRHWQIGKRLVSGLVQAARLDDFDQIPAMVVLGQPDFYEKCGFSRARAANLKTPYSKEYTMLAAPGDDVPAATLVYPKAFGDDPASK